MASSLLSTKLRIPTLRQNAVSRPRLVGKLLSSLDQPEKFVLLAAPPGFGKTTLLSEFVVTLQSAIAWVSLDGADNEPVQFWTYIITALQSAGAQVGDSALKLLQGSQPLPSEAVPTLLINELTDSGEDIVL